MLKKIYINNFRCLDNFELTLNDTRSVLLIGKNGTGKSTIVSVLKLLRDIGRGQNRIGTLVSANDFGWSRTKLPLRIEVEVAWQQKHFTYSVAFEMPDNFKEPQMFEEQLLVDGKTVFSRNKAEVTLHAYSNRHEAKFSVDWHLVALSIIQEQSASDPIALFKAWLSQIVTLSPMPGKITGKSNGETSQPEHDMSNFAEWFNGLLSQYPAAYSIVEEFLRDRFPDLQDIYREIISKEAKSMLVRFHADSSSQDKTASIVFDNLSDGEKCYFLCATIVAFNQQRGSAPMLCVWDEPDNYLSISEIGHFVTALRRSFNQKGQFLMTSHSEEGIRSFSDENTICLDRSSHLEPARARWLKDIPKHGDLISTLIRGDL